MKPRDGRVVRRAEDLRLLSDPKKLRIFEALRDEPSSPHELARRFGQKPTALYHHFARLERAGLIEVAQTRRRRGALERLYRPTTSQVVVDRALARGSAKSRSVGAVLAAASTILQVTTDDIRLAALDPSGPLADESRSEIGTTTVRLSPAAARLLMHKARALIALANRQDRSGADRVRVTLALLTVAHPNGPLEREGEALVARPARVRVEGAPGRRRKGAR